MSVVLAKPMMALNWRKIRWTLAIAYFLFVLGLGAMIIQRERPIMEVLLFDYQPIHYLRDAQTGKIIELER